uniref:Putative secreted peptide n=1 Tax=Anopheles braziliensis TaxID=58242 RepID=A0A2M3ZTF5_9DIPT
MILLGCFVTCRMLCYAVSCGILAFVLLLLNVAATMMRFVAVYVVQGLLSVRTGRTRGGGRVGPVQRQRDPLGFPLRTLRHLAAIRALLPCNWATNFRTGFRRPVSDSFFSLRRGPGLLSRELRSCLRRRNTLAR